MEIRCQIIFIKLRFWKIHELETLGARKRILRTTFERCSCARKRPVVVWIFHTFLCIFSRNSSVSKQNDREMYGQNSKRFLAQLHRSNFVLKILCLVPKVSNSRIFQKRSFMKIIWHRISMQTLYFKTRLPTRQDGFQNHDKVYYSLTNLN